jgi:MFS family permease
VVWQKFHSPALTGFEVISHWLPFLLFSPYFGALADRYDCRKLIQGSQVLFMAVSLAWGVLFATGTLTVWNACVLLVLHGIAGALWAPPEQLLLEDFVGPADLPSAIRLNSAVRSLGILCGPVVGSALLRARSSSAPPCRRRCPPSPPPSAVPASPRAVVLPTACCCSRTGLAACSAGCCSRAPAGCG